MAVRARRVSVGVRPAGLVLAAFLLLTLPMRWLLAAIAAACVHELCHILVLRLCGVAVSGFQIGEGGAKIITCPMPPWKELLCALAGPVGGICLLFFARWLPRVALCGLVQSAYNLLPVYPMDGGRAIRCLVRWILPEQYTQKAIGIVELSILTAVVVIIVYVTFCYHLGFLPLLVAAFLALRVKNVKFSCKEGRQGVQ